MVRAVQTECQTSDCNIKCRITFSFHGFYNYMYTGLNRLENQNNVYVKVMQNGMACFLLFRFYMFFMRQL